MIKCTNNATFRADCCEIFNWVCVSESRAEEQVITSSHECDYFRTKFEHKDYAFGDDSNSTFFVYVHAFKTPFWLQVSSDKSGREHVFRGRREVGWIVFNLILPRHTSLACCQFYYWAVQGMLVKSITLAVDWVKHVIKHSLRCLSFLDKHQIDLPVWHFFYSVRSGVSTTGWQSLNEPHD